MKCTICRTGNIPHGNSILIKHTNSPIFQPLILNGLFQQKGIFLPSLYSDMQDSLHIFRGLTHTHTTHYSHSLTYPSNHTLLTLTHTSLTPHITHTHSHIPQTTHYSHIRHTLHIFAFFSVLYKRTK